MSSTHHGHRNGPTEHAVHHNGHSHAHGHRHRSSFGENDAYASSSSMTLASEQARSHGQRRHHHGHRHRRRSSGNSAHGHAMSEGEGTGKGGEDRVVRRPALLQRQSSMIESPDAFWQGMCPLSAARAIVYSGAALLTLTFRNRCNSNHTHRCQPHSARQYPSHVYLLRRKISW